MLTVTRRRIIPAAIALVAAFGCGGGGDDSTGPPGPDVVVGLYTLATVNGQALPVVVDQLGNDKAEVTAGTVTLRADRTFTDITQVRLTIAGNVTNETETATGTWTRQTNTVQFNPTGFTAYSMTWDGANRLTQSVAELTLVYTK
ncbi:MAG: hypothetical protein ACREOG_01840 [Gemmatimonadaceae bacterium]